MPKLRIAEPNKRRVQFKDHYIDISGIENKEAAMLKLPGQKDLLNISLNRKRNAVYLNLKKVMPILRAEAQRLGRSLEDYMKDVTIIHTHRDHGIGKVSEMFVGWAVPSPLDYAVQIEFMLRKNTRQEMTIVIDKDTGLPLGYTFLRLNLNSKALKKYFGYTKEEYNSAVLKDVVKLDIDFNNKYYDLIDKVTKNYKKKKIEITPEEAILIIAKKLGFAFKFIPEEGCYLSKPDYNYRRIENK